MKNRVAVLVVSCDGYSDLWGPFFELFHRFWPDCPFPVYLVSNTEGAGRPWVRDILTGEDVSWSDNLKCALGAVEEEYVLLFIEDLMMLGSVDTEKVLRVFDWAVGSGAGCVRMNPTQMPDRVFNGMVGRVSPGTIYRASTVMTLWRKDVLDGLLKPGESAWDFEIRGTVRSDSYDGFYSTWEDHFPVENTVIKSKWHGRSVRKMKGLGVEVDLAKRPLMSGREEAAYFLKRQRSRLLRLAPARYRRKIKDVLVGGRYDYNKKV